MTRIRTHSTRDERGYSLVEVLVAAGVLAGVLLSISTMFVAGTQGVRSGRDLTNATTVANSIMEEILSWPFEKVYSVTGAARTETSRTWTTDEATPVYTGAATDIADWTATANRWRDSVREELQNGLISYRVDGIGRLPSEGDDGTSAYNVAHFLRVTVTVAWTESRGRRRHVTFEQLVL